MYRKLLLLSISIALLFLTACGADEKKLTEASVGDTAPDIEVINQSGELLSLDKIKFYDSVTEQPYWSSYGHNMCTYRDGYCFTGYAVSSHVGKNAGMFLGHIDKECKQCVPVCNDALCDHITPDCTAYFVGYEAQIWSYRDSLYAVKNVDGKAILVNISPDGAGRKDLFEIGISPVDNISATTLAFYNDAVYSFDRYTGLTLGLPYETSISKHSLDGKIAGKVITSNAANAAFDTVKCYGGNLFFTYKQYSNQGGMKLISTGLYRYDIYTGQIDRLLDLDVSDYAVDMENMRIYCFIADKGVYKYDLRTGEQTLLYESEAQTRNCYMSFDGQYIYLDNRPSMFFNVSVMTDENVHQVTIIDTNGQVINTVDVGKSDMVLFGDERNLFCVSEEVFDHKIEFEFIDPDINPEMIWTNAYVSFGPSYFSKKNVKEGTDFINIHWP